MSFWRRIKLLSPREGYDLWAKSYHAEGNPIKETSDNFITKNLPDLRSKSILDAGCGTGKFCAMAAERGASFVKGIDLSPVMIEEAKRNFPTGQFECADLSDVRIEARAYDVVICGLVLGHIEEQKKPLTALIDAIKPGGVLVITDFHPEQTANNAKRTFKDSRSGKTFEVRHTLHSLDEYLSLLKNMGIKITSFEEPLFKGKPVIFGIAGVKS